MLNAIVDPAGGSEEAVPDKNPVNGDPANDLAEADALWTAMHEAHGGNAGKDTTPEPDDRVPSSREVTRNGVNSIVPLDMTAFNDFITANRSDVEIYIIDHEKDLLKSLENLMTTELNNFFGEKKNLNQIKLQMTTLKCGKILWMQS